MVKPDLKDYREYVWNNKVGSNKLINLVTRGDHSFQMAGFFFTDNCILKREKNRHFKCYDARKLDDISWVREQFPYLGIPMIVFSETAMDSMKAAALLRSYGYDAFMLEGGFRKFKNHYMSPVDISAAKSSAEKDRLVRKKMLYKFLTGKDDNLGRKALYDFSAVGRGISASDDGSGEGEGC